MEGLFYQNVSTLLHWNRLMKLPRYAIFKNCNMSANKVEYRPAVNSCIYARIKKLLMSV